MKHISLRIYVTSIIHVKCFVNNTERVFSKKIKNYFKLAETQTAKTLPTQTQHLNKTKEAAKQTNRSKCKLFIVYLLTLIG